VNWLKLQELSFANFGPFVGSHKVDLPQSGLLLIKGKVNETGGGSGAGKTFFLNTISHIYGGCPFAATELQSWYTDDPPDVQSKLETKDGIFSIGRKKGLTVKGGNLTDSLKGKTAEAQLDRIFEMDAELRALVTYRPQRKPGLFLSMSDPEKKSFLTKLLDLEKFEKVSDLASKAVSALDGDISFLKRDLETKEQVYKIALEKLNEIVVNPEESETVKSQIKTLQTTVTYLETSIKQIDDNISNLRHDSNEELEDALSVVKCKIQAVNNLDKPEEINTYKATLTELKEKLDKCRQYDNDQKLVVQKLRSDLENEITKLKAYFREQLNALQAKFNADISKVNLEISSLVPAAAELNRLKSEEARLRDSLCPRCERIWDKAQIDLVKTVEAQKVQEEKLAKLAVKKKELEALQLAMKQETDALKARGVLELNSKKSALEAIKDPEPHPMGVTLVVEIGEVTKRLDQAETAFKAEKSLRLTSLFEDEKAIKTEFSNKLNTAIMAEKESYNKLCKEKEETSLQIRALEQNISNFKQLEAVKKERQGVVNMAVSAMEKATKNYQEKQVEYNLQSDIVALVGRNGFLGAIFSDVLTEISAQANDILSQVANVRHLSIEFETEKVAASSGNVSSRITPVIYNRGRKVSFKSGVSGGMQVAVELGVDLAVSNVVGSRRGVYPNFLMLDESLHGLDSVAKESCIEMLQSVVGERLVLVVDHSSEFCNLFNQVIEVEQVDGISRIV